MNDTNSSPSSARARHTPLHTWDLASIFEDVRSWEEEFAAVKALVPQSASYSGRLLESAATLREFLELEDALSVRVDKLSTYASLSYYVNTANQEARALLDRAQQLSAEFATCTAFFEPEILGAPAEKVRALIDADPQLARYQFTFEELERSRPHVLGAEAECVLGALSPLYSMPESFRTSLHDGELTFNPVVIGAHERAVSHGSIDALLADPDREVRKRAYESYTNSYRAFPQTFAEALTAEAKMSATLAKVRRFESTFDAVLHREALPHEVYRAVLQSCREQRPLFHRYFRARAKLLGLEKVAEYDLAAPLTTDAPPIPYERATTLVLEALTPLGEQYQAIARRGLTVERWADVYPADGKYSNAFSSGSYATRPFLLLNYAPNMQEVGTLAHELGHSMHSYLANREQLPRYASYSSMVAETASNLNQVLLRAYVLKGADRATALTVLEEAFFFAHRYLFLMPTMSEVEHFLHCRYAEGGAVSAEELAAQTVASFGAAYGDAVEYDPVQLGLKWAKFCHFYSPYYFFQYAIGISAAMAVGKRLLAGDQGVREAYLEFLEAAGSAHPTDIFKIVGVDISAPALYREAFSLVEHYVSHLEQLSDR